MPKKLIVSIVIVMVAVIMIADFRINKAWVFESYFRQMETSSLRELQHGNLNITDYDDLNKVVYVNESIIDLKKEEISSLQLENPMGSVIVSGEDRSDIRMNYKITLYSEREIVEEKFKDIQIVSSFKNSILGLSPERLEIPSYIRGIKIDYDLRVPNKLALNISNRHGELVVNGIKNDVTLRNYFDQLRVTAIEGDAVIHARYGSLYVVNISGKTSINTSYNNAEIYNLGADLNLKSDKGTVRVAGIRGNANIDCSYGSMTVENVKKDVELQARFTQIRGQEIEGQIKGEMRYGNLDLFNLKNSINFKGHYTNMNVDLTDNLVDYYVLCKTDFGEISSNLPFEVKQDNNLQYLEGTTGEGKLKIDIQTNRANISIFK